MVKIYWCVGGFCAVAAGVFLAMDLQMLETTMVYSKDDFSETLEQVFWGIGRPFGAVVGGLVIGLAEEATGLPWFGNGSLIDDTVIKLMLDEPIMVIMLVVRPSGLFKGRLF